MDDGEVISRRLTSLNNSNFGEFSDFSGENCGEPESTMVCDDKSMFVADVRSADVEKCRGLREGSIPARGNPRFEPVLELCGHGSMVNLKLPNIGLKRKSAAAGSCAKQLKNSGTSMAGKRENSVVNLKMANNGQTGENCRKDPGNGNGSCGDSVVNLKLPQNGQLGGNGRCEIQDELRGESVVNLKLPKNGQVRIERKSQNDGRGDNSVVNLKLPKNGQAWRNGQNCRIDCDGENLLGENEAFIGGDSVVSLKLPKNGQNFRMVVGNGDFRGGNLVRLPSAEPPLGKKCPSAEWGEPRAVKEELFRGLGLVPRGVLHDNGRPVDRRHCVTGRRTVQADSELAVQLAERGFPDSGPAESAERPRNVFYPSGVPTMFDTEKFIGEIQKRPAIYDVRSKVYSNRVAKLKYWHEVGKEMYKGWEDLDQMERRSLVKELQIKWKSIRDHFMRQLKQNINGEGPRKKKYVHFDQLQFLTANLGVKRRWQPWKRNWDGGDDLENSMSGSGCSRVKEEQDPLMQDPLRVYDGPRHAYRIPKAEPDEEYMEFTPELPEERHFSFVTSDEQADYDEREVPVAALLPIPQPEDLSYHKEPPYYHHQDLSYHKELEGDRMGNKMFLLSLLPIMERLPDHANIRARLQLMEVLQAFVAHEDAPRRDYYNHTNHHNASEKRDCDASQQHSTTSHSDSDS